MPGDYLAGATFSDVYGWVLDARRCVVERRGWVEVGNEHEEREAKQIAELLAEAREAGRLEERKKAAALFGVYGKHMGFCNVHKPRATRALGGCDCGLDKAWALLQFGAVLASPTPGDGE